MDGPKTVLVHAIQNVFLAWRTTPGGRVTWLRRIASARGAACHWTNLVLFLLSAVPRPVAAPSCRTSLADVCQV